MRRAVMCLPRFAVCLLLLVAALLGMTGTASANRSWVGPWTGSVRDEATNAAHNFQAPTASPAVEAAVQFLQEHDKPRNKGNDILDGNQKCHVVVYGSPLTGSYIVINHYDKDSEYNSYCNDDIFTDRIDIVPSGSSAFDVGKNAGACDCGSGNGDGTTPSGSVVKSDPVNVATGNKSIKETDYAAPDGLLTFRRFYNSVVDGTFATSSFGVPWRHSFQRELKIAAPITGDPTFIQVDRPDGSSNQFTLSSVNHLWNADAEVRDVLTSTNDAAGHPISYTLTLFNVQQVETYYADGRLRDVRDLHTGQMIYAAAYSDASTPISIAPKADLLIAISDVRGRTLRFTYDAQSRLLSMTAPDGGVVQYGYDTATGPLSSVTAADGTVRRYLYDEADKNGGVDQPYALTGVVDENGVRFETTIYDARGRVTSTEKVGGADRLALVYDTSSIQGPATMTGPLGGQTTLSFVSPRGRKLVSTSSQFCGEACDQPFHRATYDDNGYPSQIKDYKDVATDFTYDANGLVTHKVEASGTDIQRNTSMTWDVVHRVPLTRAISNASSIVVAKNMWSYNARGQMTAECDIDPAVTVNYTCGSQAHAPTGIRQTRYTYCDDIDTTQCPSVGLLLTVDGPRNDVTDLTRYTYYLTTDESGCGQLGGSCHHAGDLNATIDPSGHTSTEIAYDRGGRVARSKDVNGVLTDFAYTTRGWLASRTVRSKVDGTPSANDTVTLLTYDPTSTLASVTDPDGVKIAFTYDAAHRLIDVANNRQEHVHYTLDAVGNRIKEETFDASGISRRSLTRSYNTAGQLMTVMDGLGQLVFDASAADSYDSNGNLLQSKDPLGIVRKDTYDALSRVVTSVANAGGDDAATRDTIISKVFDALDQVKSITDPDGLVTTYGYDGLSNPTTLTSPDTGTSRATFNVAGNALTRTDAKGSVATNAYDALGRMISTSYPDATLNVAYHFDEADSITGCQGSFPIGRLTRIVETAVTTVYCYDNQGRVSEQRQTQGTVTDTTDYVYTLAGRLAGIASPSGLVTAYSRDALGQITGVTVTPLNGTTTNVVTGASYLPFGPIARYTLGNGQTLTRTYDANYQVTDVVSPALALHFARDAAGNIKALGDTAGASTATETYTYDPLYRLTGVNDPVGKAIEAYTYNRTGDRLSKTAPGQATGTYGYRSGTHRLVSIGAESRTYDANGSTTGSAQAGTAWAYTYNYRGRLTAVKQNGATVGSYVYNAISQRVAKTAAVGTTRFNYGSDGKLLAEVGASDRSYIWMDATPIAVMDGLAIAFIHADALQTPRIATDNTGSVVWTLPVKNNPFGESQPHAVGGFHLESRLPGQYFDAESGLNYNVNRDYEAATGRYIQSDPIGLAGGVATYGYVEGNPLAKTDFLGLTDLNLFPPSSMLYTSAQKFVSPPGTYVVGAHGNPITIVDQNGQPLSPGALAALIQKDPAYQSGETVLLLSCNTGVTPDAKWNKAGSFAKLLAKSLNANVQAPDHFGWMFANGAFESRGGLINGQPVTWDNVPINPGPMKPDPNDPGTLIEVTP